MPVINVLSLLLLVVGLLFYIGFTFLVRQGLKPDLRPMPGYDNLYSQIGQAVESGGRVHIALGSSGVIDKDTGVTLAGMQMLEIISEASSISDRSPVASTGDATAAFVSSDTIRRAYQKRNTFDKYETMSTRLIAFDPYPYAGGATSIVYDDEVRSNVLIGSFGPEIMLITDAGNRKNLTQIIGSDRLEAQAVGYVMTDYNLIGEEMFTAKAYLQRSAPAIGSLLTQDVLRWIIIGVILAGTALKTFGLI